MHRNSFYAQDLSTRIETDFPASFESLEPRLLLAAAPMFETDLASAYGLTLDGKGVTIGIDGFDADGDDLTISVTTAGDDTGLTTWVYDHDSGNRFAVLHFEDANGEAIGDVKVQLFEGRAPLATERFITLAENYVDAEGNLLAPTVDDPAFYTDVAVHRVIDGFMLQTGDAENDDGTGGSPLGTFDDQFDPVLSFTGPGVLAMANSGVDTNDSQWFITDNPTLWLDGGHTIFGQIISGQDIYEQLISADTDAYDRPVSAITLASVDIIDDGQDGTITFAADDTFTGPTDVTITLTDGNGGSVSQTITLMPHADVAGPAGITDAQAGTTIDVPVTVTLAEDRLATIYAEHTYDGPGTVNVTYTAAGDPTEYTVHVELPADYDGREFWVGLAAVVDDFGNGMAADGDPVNTGFNTGQTWVASFPMEFATPTLSPLADVDDLAPDESRAIELSLAYAGELPLSVAATSTYANGGELNLDGAITAPAGEGDSWTLTLDMPAEYDGEAFEVTITAAVEGFEQYGVSSQTFEVTFGERPVLSDVPQQIVTPGNEAAIDMTITDPDGDVEFTWTATTGDNDLDTAIGLTIDQATGQVTFTPPADETRTFNITVTAIERALAAHAGLPRATTTFNVVSIANELPTPVPMERVHLAPGGNETLPIDVLFAGDEDVTLSAVAHYANGGTLVLDQPTLVDGQWELDFTLPAEYNGELFTITVTANLVDFPLDEPNTMNIEVWFGQRPVVTDAPATILPGTENRLPLTLTDPDGTHTDFTIDVETDNDNVSVSYDAATGELVFLTPSGFNESFDITIRAIETPYIELYGDLTWSEQTFTVDVIDISSVPDQWMPAGGMTTVSIDTPYTGDGTVTMTAAVAGYAGEGSITVVQPVYVGDHWQLDLTVPAEYDGSAFDVTLAVSVDGVAMTTDTFAVSSSIRPTMVDPGPLPVVAGATTKTPVSFTRTAEDLTVTIDHDGPAGTTVEYRQAEGELWITMPDELPADFDGHFTVTVSTIETDWAGFANIEPGMTEIDVVTSVAFGTELQDSYVLPTDGHGLTIGVDGWAPDGQDVRVTARAATSNSNLLITVADDNRFAELVFVEEDGTEIGTVLVQLFDDRSPEAVERFVTLATNEVVLTGYDLDEQVQTYELDPNGTPYYTDVPVHRTIDGFMFQTGDAANGDGTGTTGMGGIVEDFGPDPYRAGNLSFAGAGVLAFANRGAGTDSSDSQFFITDGATDYLNEGYVIFGQIVSGQDVYDEIVSRRTNDDDQPYAMPYLAGVNIIEPEDNTQDATITFVGEKNFSGEVEVIVTLKAGDARIEKTITLVDSATAAEAPSLGAVITDVPIAAGTSAEIPFYATTESGEPLTFAVQTTYSGEGTVSAEVIDDPADYKYALKLDLPAEYAGESFEITVTADGAVATFTVHGENDISYWADNTTDTMFWPFAVNQVLVQPGSTIEIPFEARYEGDSPLTITATHNHLGEGQVEVLVEAGDRPDKYVLTVIADADYDGEPFTIDITLAGAGNLTTRLIYEADLFAKPTISADELTEVGVGEDATIDFEVSHASGGEFEVVWECPQAGIVTVIADLGDGSYQMTVATPADFEGIIPVTIKARRLSSDATFDNAWTEFTVYVSTLGDRPEITRPGDDGDELYQTIYVDSTDGISLSDIFVSDDQDQNVTYTVSTSSTMALGQLLDGLDADGFGDDGNQSPFMLTLPAGFMGIFELTVTAVEDVPYAEDALEPATRTFTIVASPTGGDDLQLDSEGHIDIIGQTTAAYRDGDYLYLGRGIFGVQIYDVSDPANPVLHDELHYDDGFIGSVVEIEKCSIVGDDGQSRDYLLVAADRTLWRMELVDVEDADGNITRTIGQTDITYFLDDGEVTYVPAMDVAIKDGVAYVAAKSYGLRAYDLTDPNGLPLLDSFYFFTPSTADILKYQEFLLSPGLYTYGLSNAVGVEIQGDRLYVAEQDGWYVISYTGGLVSNPSTKGFVGMIDISDPTNLRGEGVIKTTEYIMDIDMLGGTLYVLGEENLRTFGTYTSTIELERPGISITVANESAVVTTTSGYDIYDVADPRRATLEGTFYCLTPYWNYSLTSSPAAFGGESMYLPASDGGMVILDAEQIKPEDTVVTRSETIMVAGTPVTVRISGGGQVEVKFDDFDHTIDQLIVTGSTERTSISISAPSWAELEIEDVIIDGDINSFSAPKATLSGDFTVSGSMKKLVLGDIGFDAIRTEQTLTIGPAGGTTTASITLGSVYDLTIDSQTPIRTLTALQWIDDESDYVDADGAPQADGSNRIEAPSLYSLNIRGYRGDIDGDFQADLNLTDTGPKALYRATIAGDVSESDWTVAGDAGTITVRGAFTDGDIDIAGEVRTLSLASLSNTDIDVNRIQRLTVAGDVANSNWTATRSIDRITVRGSIDDATITLGGVGFTLSEQATASVTIYGDMTDTTWDIDAAVGTVYVRGNVVGGEIDVAGSAKTLKVLGDVTDTSWIVGGDLTTAYVKGSVNDAAITVTGSTKTIQVNGDVTNSMWFVGGDLTSKAYVRGDMNDSGIVVAGSAKTLQVNGDVTNSPWTVGGDLTSKAYVRGNVNDSAIAVTGSAKTLQVLGDVTDSSWTVGGDLTKAYVRGSFTGDAAALDADRDVISAGGDITTVQLGAIAHADIAADSVRTASIKGNVTDSEWDIAGDARTITVKGTLTDARVLVGGDVRTFSAGAMVGTDLYAGYIAADRDAVTGLPTEAELTDATLFDPTRSIRTATVKGVKIDRSTWMDSVVDSNIAAAAITSASFVYAAIDNGDTAFGLATADLGRFSYRDTTLRDSWTGATIEADGTPAELEDLVIRIV